MVPSRGLLGGTSDLCWTAGMGPVAGMRGVINVSNLPKIALEREDNFQRVARLACGTSHREPPATSVSDKSVLRTAVDGSCCARRSRKAPSPRSISICAPEVRRSEGARLPNGGIHRRHRYFRRGGPRRSEEI